GLREGTCLRSEREWECVERLARVVLPSSSHQSSQSITPLFLSFPFLFFCLMDTAVITAIDAILTAHFKTVKKQMPRFIRGLFGFQVMILLTVGVGLAILAAGTESMKVSGAND